MQCSSFPTCIVHIIHWVFPNCSPSLATASKNHTHASVLGCIACIYSTWPWSCGVMVWTGAVAARTWTICLYLSFSDWHALGCHNCSDLHRPAVQPRPRAVWATVMTSMETCQGSQLPPAPAAAARVWRIPGVTRQSVHPSSNNTILIFISFCNIWWFNIGDIIMFLFLTVNIYFGLGILMYIRLNFFIFNNIL